MGNITSFSDQNEIPFTKRQIKKYGWVVDIPDSRDIWVSIPEISNIKTKTDLRMSNFLPVVHNQGDLGSCATHSVIDAYTYDLNKNGIKLEFIPSISFLYYNQRYINGTEQYDSGSSIRDTIKVINRIGLCSEELYPYDTIFYTDKPSLEAYTESKRNIRPMLYKRVKPVIDDILKVLCYDIPVIFGFSVCESFEHPDVSKTGLVPVPKIGERVIGSHTALIVGYDTEKKLLIVKNSHGIKFGALGYFWLPFSYINSRYCADLWIVYSNRPKKQQVHVHQPQPQPQPQPQQVVKIPEPQINTPSPVQIPQQVPSPVQIPQQIPSPVQIPQQVLIPEQIPQKVPSPVQIPQQVLIPEQVFEQSKIIEQMGSSKIGQDAENLNHVVHPSIPFSAPIVLPKVSKNITRNRELSQISQQLPEQMNKYTQEYIDNIIDSDDSDSVNYVYKSEPESE